MFLPRFLLMIVGVPSLLLLIHLGALPFLFFVLGITLLALYEYGLILWIGGRGIQRWILLAGGGALSFAVGLGVPGGDPPPANFVFMVLSLLIVVVMLREMFRKEHSLDRAALTLFGTVFIAWNLGHLTLLRDLRPYGERLTFFLFLTAWITDSAAYSAGKSLGRYKLAPVISPKKTWEGAAAGLLAAVAFAAFAQRTFLNQVLSVPESLAAGLFIGVMGQLSDLAKSVIKRAVGVKDSSALLPGHGGILDRFDSFLLTAPILYYALALKFK